ncbi:MAG TPA: hypothetical protein O0X99_02345 [Methanocorpusculum sp.]|nr:hypothetical protein [Methanocorpusculum sp.]
MSIETAAATLAHHITDLKYIEMYVKSTVDGIAAAAIMSIALSRVNIRFKLKILSDISIDDIKNPKISLICDFDLSSISFDDEKVMILDHHTPNTQSIYQINPCMFGENGYMDISSAGCAYLVATEMDNTNRDLASLVMLGIIGDNQRISGYNQKIVQDATENNLIHQIKRILLVGRSVPEMLNQSLHPYLPGISGNNDKSTELSKECIDQSSNDLNTASLLSKLVAESSIPYKSIWNIYGDSWDLSNNEVISNVHEFVTLIDSCIKFGQNGIAYALCCGDTKFVDEAWEYTSKYRTNMVSILKTAKQIRYNPDIWSIENVDVIDDVVDILRDLTDKPIFVIYHDNEWLQVSASVQQQDTTLDLKQILNTIVETCRGSCSGFKYHANAKIPLEHENKFFECLSKSICT